MRCPVGWRVGVCVAFVTTALASPARAAAPPADGSMEPPSTGGGLWGPRFPGQPWELALALDYSRAVGDGGGLEVDPYRLGLAFSAGYFWPGGLGLALVGDVYVGSTISQTYTPPLTEIELDLDAQSQLFDIGASVSYDQPLGPVLLRYALATYVGLMSWEMGNWPYPSVEAYSLPKGDAVVFSLDPGLSLLWPVGRFFMGARVHSRISFASELPSAFGGSLGMGVRF